MTPKGYPREKGDRMKRTTVDLPLDLWRAAKIKAMDEAADLRHVIIEALEAYLNRSKSKRDR